jgi:alginate O-acetyltransferase complex protein AlgI
MWARSCSALSRCYRHAAGNELTLMLFNSYQFILGFLPLTVAVFYIFGRFSRTAALRWVIFASLVFYAWWRPLNVAIILPSIIINYVIARRLLRLCANEEHRRAAKLTLVAGIVFNIVFLGYFKYTNFLAEAANDAFGTGFVLTHIILPLGISFITFQKIAFLIDVHGRRVQSFTFSDYSLFVLFFPQLIAGPIVHYREVMPQFQSTRCRLDVTDLSVGITMFCLGLFKKAFLADGIAPYVTPIYERATHGDPVSVLPAIMAAIGFTLQIYFDFSGYSDMAIGIGRMFGIRLPDNFDSPLRASSIIDYWLRWHITLTRFLTAYIYNPLLLWLTRRRLARGLPALGGRNATLSAFLTLLAFPTIVTMAISGLWHGAGYTFIVWGVLHGLYLSINHGWRLLKAKFRLLPGKSSRSETFAGVVLTFTAVTVAIVFFRAPTLRGAWNLLTGMFGAHGIGVPASIFEHLGPLTALLERTGGGPEQWWGAADFVSLTAWTILLFAIAMLCPNSAQLLAHYEPALGVRALEPAPRSRLRRLAWNPSVAWALAVGAIAAAAILRLGGPSEFLYWQF